jgi:hypothetical protein
MYLGPDTARRFTGGCLARLFAPFGAEPVALAENSLSRAKRERNSPLDPLLLANPPGTKAQMIFSHTKLTTKNSGPQRICGFLPLSRVCCRRLLVDEDQIPKSSGRGGVEPCASGPF